MQRIRASVGDYYYDIHLDNGLTGRLGDRLSETLHPRRALLIVDENIDRLYGARVVRSLEAAMIRPYVLTLPTGGYAQTLDALREITAAMSDMALSPEDALVAMGGGKLCDSVGYAAWNYKSVVRLVYVPTTLIGMADWAVGGKTALEYKLGSRMIGSFFPPTLTLIDPQTVCTMTEREFESGMAEVIKRACAADAALFHQLETLTGRAAIEVRMEEIAWRCLAIKQSLSGRDRTKLLLGHGMANAIETAQRYRGLLHGEAVGVGMRVTACASERCGMSARGTADRIAECLQRYHLPMTAVVDPDFMLRRIHALGESLDTAVPERVGWCAVRHLGNAFFADAWFNTPM